MEKLLPIDIILDILSRLPHQTMIICKLVSKPWRDIISSNIKVGFLLMLGVKSRKLFYGGEEYDGDYSYKTLVEIDNHRSVELQLPLSSMVGSCNGLACFKVQGKSSFAPDPIYICNPFTNEYVYLPTIFNCDQACKGKIAGYFSCGFGYHHSTDEYKVVRIYYDYYNYNVVDAGQVQVYTLGSGHGWRDIGRIDHHLVTYPGVCANGALHWFELLNRRIVAFNLADEKFQLIPLPPLLPSISSDLSRSYLKLLGGCLCVVHIDAGKQDKFINIWALEKKKFSSNDINYDMKEHEFNDFWRWSKIFSIPCPKNMRYTPFGVTKSNQVLMSSIESIFCYDSETKILRKLWGDGPGMILGAIPHMNSLVSLHALGEKSKRRK